MGASGGSGGRFSALLLEGLDHYRKGRMLEAVRAWEEAYLLEPTNLRAREFLRSALERIHAHMGPPTSPLPVPPSIPPRPPAQGGPAPAPHPWLPEQPIPVPSDLPAQTQTFASPLPQAAEQPEASASTIAHETSPSIPQPPATEAKTRNPWDDGPSLAIPQPEAPGDETSGAWAIHKEALPNEAVADDETQVWMRGARELVGLNDFSGALELVGKILERKPGDKDAQQMHELCESNLTLMFESKIGRMDGRPRIAIPPDEIIWLNLDPRAGFVLAQIDGEVSFEDLYAICGLKRLDTARILCELLEQGVVQVQGQEKAVAKRAMPRS